MSLRAWQLRTAATALALVAIGCSDVDQAEDYRDLQDQLSEESQTIWEVLPSSSMVVLSR